MFSAAWAGDGDVTSVRVGLKRLREAISPYESAGRVVVAVDADGLAAVPRAIRGTDFGAGAMSFQPL